MGEVPDGSAPPARPWRDRAALTTVATYLVIAATAWYLLRELAPLLRPLCLAVFLAYVILPVQARLARRTSGAVAYVVLGLVLVAGLYLLVLLTYRSAVGLNAELPQYTQRVRDLLVRAEAAARQRPWLADLLGERALTRDVGAGQVRAAAATLASSLGDLLSEGLVVGVYLLFLLLEVGRFPGRVRGGFAPARAERILAVVGNVNAAIASYLKVKVLASLLLAAPVVIILAAFGVHFALLWGVLTFLLNFIPYVGSAVSCTLPCLLAFLQLDPDWRPVAVTGLLLADHLLSANVVEPALTGKAVNISPLAILLALGFWGLCWGLVGMLLAVPLTVVLKIVLENLSATRPLAALMAEG
jgi:AI-2 transport protein TqsA